MPRSEYNRGRQRSTKHEICTNGLLTLRGQQLKHLRLGTDTQAQANIDAIDHVLIKVIGYDGDIAEESRDFRRQAVFKRGELRRAVGDILRKADRPLTTLEIAKLAYAQKGIEVSYSRKVKNRVNIVLKVINRMSNVQREKDTNGNVVWSAIQTH